MTEKSLRDLTHWWAKPQVYGFTEVVKIEYRSDWELWI